MSAQAQYHMFQQQQMLQQQFDQQNAMRYMYDGPVTPLPSSGYGSAESQFCWPIGNSFAFLCFLPGMCFCSESSVRLKFIVYIFVLLAGTRLKFIIGDDHPGKCEWQLAEALRNDNFSSE
jgi:hypothetical protein